MRMQGPVEHLDADRNKLAFELELVLLVLPARQDQHAALQP